MKKYPLIICSFLFILLACEIKGDKSTPETIKPPNKKTSITYKGDTSLNSRVLTYLQLYKDLKFDTLMDYVYPGLFKLAPREQLAGFFKSFVATPGVDVKMDTMKLLSIDPVSPFSDGEVAKFNYNMQMRLKITPQNGQQSIANNRNVVINTLKKSLGTNDVTFNEETGYFKVRAVKSALAIKDDSSGHEWKIIGLENNEQLKSVLPVDVAQKYYPAKGPIGQSR
ncbi:MAG: hypothetical protein M3342_17475 [Bacteroidota bacterium]|nr:hypothetical protein [Flavisolibacter sp.]MBD0350437.1 hypothetical protein [Flavisolibacter sp.]MBD0365016.1 hypothetical protein [Flavisolibacter sp.]MBD0377593.1 hypothetical protein [Flavisolibacter sp.]MDQ3845779.1 hypothetical protein [Bacteroidota bacterium]